ncbi:hypothetical protein A3F66_05045 [candidate division TM6 bacterium RIFCSPHIGHO2_12_FULL_32_22]|nr:MAG: hypothetical protein A3F66_05045 [candidate division TM6 bacterium RIFCSPHIGHO2_12_FULL_32_22]
MADLPQMMVLGAGENARCSMKKVYLAVLFIMMPIEMRPGIAVEKKCYNDCISTGKKTRVDCLTSCRGGSGDSDNASSDLIHKLAHAINQLNKAITEQNHSCLLNCTDAPSDTNYSTFPQMIYDNLTSATNLIDQLQQSLHLRGNAVQ